MVMTDKHMNLTGQRLLGLLLVLALHGLALYGLWRAQLLPVPADAPTLFISLIAPPAEKKAPEPQRLPESTSQPKPKPLEPVQPHQLVAETPVTAPIDHVAAAPPVKPEPLVAPVVAAPPVQTTMPTGGPVALSSELLLVCPYHPAHRYPTLSKNRGESGRVVLQVEVNEEGQITSTQIHSSSGFERLDDAALAAVRNWRCTPQTRNGQPVRATALQPFKFELQGN
jgi:protein TonB